MPDKHGRIPFKYSGGTFQKAATDYLASAEYREAVERVINQRTLLDVFAVSEMQGAIPDSIDTDELDGEDPWSR